MSWYLTKKCPRPHSINVDYHLAIKLATQVEIPHGENRAHLCSEQEPVGFFSQGGLPVSRPIYPIHLLQQRRSCFSYIKVEKESFFLLYLSVPSFNLIGSALDVWNRHTAKNIYWVLITITHQTLFQVLGHSNDQKRANPHKTKLLSSQDLNSSGDTPSFKENMTTLLHMWEPYITSKTAQESNQ